MTFRDEVIEETANAMEEMEGFELDLNLLGENEVVRRRIKYVKSAEGKLYTVAQAYNNPGNIMGKWGTNRTSKDGYVIFPTLAAGRTALKRQVSLNFSRKLSFYEFFAGQRHPDGTMKPGGYYGYAPAQHGGNNPRRYAEFVVEKLNERFGKGWTIDTRVEEFLT